MSGYTLDVAEGVARLLAAAGLVAYEGAPAGLPPVHVQSMRDRDGLTVAVAAYPVTDDPATAMSVVGVQVKVRDTATGMRPASDLTDAIFGVLHGYVGRLPLDGDRAVKVTHAHRQSGTPLGQDDDGDWQTTSNYYFTVYRPGINRY